MQISDQVSVKLKAERNSTNNSMAPLTWLLNLFALSCNSEHKSSFIIIKSFATVITLGALTFFSLYYKITYIYDSIVLSIKLTDFVQMIFDYFQYIIDIYFVYKYGRHIISVYFKHYELIDKLLDVADYAMIKWNLVKLLGIFTLIWVTSSASDFIAWVFSYGWIAPIIYFVSYIFLFIKILTILNLTGHVMLIETRLNIMGDMMEKFYFSVKASPGSVADCLNNRDWLYSYGSTRTLQIKPRPIHEENHEIKTIIRCYFLLTEQVAFINNMYGFRIVLNSLSLLIDMVRFTNLAVRIASGSQQTPYKSGYFPAISSVMRLLTCIAMLSGLVEHCERTYRQKERLINIIDHLLINKNPSEDLQRVMGELRNLVQERPISFNMANVFEINYSWLVSIASVVVTYTIILLQSVN